MSLLAWRVKLIVTGVLWFEGARALRLLLPCFVVLEVLVAGNYEVFISQLFQRLKNLFLAQTYERIISIVVLNYFCVTKHLCEGVLQLNSVVVVQS